MIDAVGLMNLKGKEIRYDFKLIFVVIFLQLIRKNVVCFSFVLTQQNKYFLTDA
jgi:hypothetical protein